MKDSLQEYSWNMIREDVEDEAVKKEGEIIKNSWRLLSPLKAPDSIEARLFAWRLQNDDKNEWMNDNLE